MKDAAPTPRWLLLLPYLVILLAAALTPDFELHANQGDVGLYLRKAVDLASGLVPYRDFPFEYPPLALVPMAVPYVSWPFSEVTVEVYKWLFAGWQAVLVLLLGFVLTWIVRLGGAGRGNGGPASLRFVALQLFVLTVGAALAIAFRFDMFPTLLVMVAIWATLENRPGMAGLTIGLGILAKLFPVVVVPALAVAWLVPLDVRRLARFGTAIAVTVALVMTPFLLLAGTDALSFLGYQAARGLQIESIGGGLVLLDGLLRGQPVILDSPFAAQEVTGDLGAAWLSALPLLTAVGFGVLGLLGWQRIRAERVLGSVQSDTVVRLATLAVLILLATSKVFSIQYIVWIVPFAALLRGRRFWIAAALVALTIPIHPLFYHDLVEQQALPILLLNIRNALLLVLVGSVSWSLARGERSSEGVARPAGLEPTTFRSAT